MSSLNKRNAGRNGTGNPYRGTSQSQDGNGLPQQSREQPGSTRQPGNAYTSNSQWLTGPTTPGARPGIAFDLELNAPALAQTVVTYIERGLAPHAVADEAMAYAIKQGAVHIRIDLDNDAGHKLQWSRSTPRPLEHPDAHRHEAAHRSASIGLRVQVTLWIDKSDDVPVPAARPSPTPPCSVVHAVTEAPTVAAQQLIDALPAWALEQQATDVRRMVWKVTARTPEELMTFLEEDKPGAIAVHPGSARARLDSLKHYSVVGRFASGAVRTVGKLGIDANGRGAVNAFGYWSLIDPDDTELDPEKTCVIESTIDFLAVEVL